MLSKTKLSPLFFVGVCAHVGFAVMCVSISFVPAFLLIGGGGGGGDFFGDLFGGSGSGYAYGDAISTSTSGGYGAPAPANNGYNAPPSQVHAPSSNSYGAPLPSSNNGYTGKRNK